MENTHNYNRIFQYTVTGALLFIATIVFVLLNLTSVAHFNVPYTVAALALGVSSIALLYKAIKDDNPGMRTF